MQRVVTVYAEVTPNPSTMKFVTDVMLMNGGKSAEFLSATEAKGYSNMAEALFNFPFVKSVFFANNFVTVTKTDVIEWEYVSRELREFVKSWVENHDSVVEQIPEPRSMAKTDGNEKTIVSVKPELNTETDRLIHNLLEEYVKPAVESDGGAIDFKSFDELTGTVTVVLRGSCSGCPSSTATLKGGIESLLKTHCPEVNEVVALEG
ncbi:MAG: NifU family protein [Flavobacteriales bacterium]|nr:NifU family protein [Flavobacteriales bacterium]MCB9198249.1 NifU family protein [Flavobacteriales bacterium]